MDKDKIIKGFIGIDKKTYCIAVVVFICAFFTAFVLGSASEAQKIRNGEVVSSSADTSLIADINAGRIFITLSESNLTEMQLKLLKNAGYVFYADDARYFGLEHTKVFVKNSELAHCVIGKDKLKDLQELKSF